VPRSGYLAFLVLFVIAAFGGGQLHLDISDTDHCPDGYSSLILSFRASPYLALLISKLNVEILPKN